MEQFAIRTKERRVPQVNQFKRLIKDVIYAIILNTAFMESSFHCMILSKIVNVVYIVLCINF